MKLSEQTRKLLKIFPYFIQALNSGSTKTANSQVFDKKAPNIRLSKFLTPNEFSNPK
jgi:hypothetical protein